MTIIFLLVMTHITILAVTVFLHRSQAHRSVELHPILSHFFRFWLWLTTGMVTKEWVAIHRKHHRYTEDEGDPHSPYVYGIFRVLFGGAFLYADAAKDKTMVQQYGVGTPDDWLEQYIYSTHSSIGILLMLVIDLLFFGPWGFIVWGIQMIWIPFWAAGVINGLGHWWGYRNGKTKDNSRNLLPVGFVVGGEELHNNHHLEPANPKLSRRWFEIDIGWVYIKLFEFLHLAKVRRV